MLKCANKSPSLLVYCIKLPSNCPETSISHINRSIFRCGIDYTQQNLDVLLSSKDKGKTKVSHAICFNNYHFRLGFLEFVNIWTNNFMVRVMVRVMVGLWY